MIDETLLDAEEKMEKAVSVAKDELASVRTGRANPAMFSRIVVDYYGSPTPLNQLAGINDPGGADGGRQAVRREPAGRDREGDPRLRPGRQPEQRRHDHPRSIIPQLSEERRREMVKVAKSKGEDAKVSIRNVRRKANEELHRIAKDGEAGEDEVARAEKELQHLTDKYVTQVDELVKHKEAELLEV